MILSPLELAILGSLESWNTLDELAAAIETQFDRAAVESGLELMRSLGWVERFRGHRGQWVYRRTRGGSRRLRQQRARLERLVRSEGRRLRAA